MAKRILFIGESWYGSCARSLKEALGRNPEVVLDEVNEDLYQLRGRAFVLRLARRLTTPWCLDELFAEILSRVELFKPDVLMVYKGNPFNAEFLKTLRKRGLPVVNVYPDCSPHAHGQKHRASVGEYSLVISTKSFHPPNWRSVYQYDNRCIFVPQGYDPLLHLYRHRAEAPTLDLTLVATWRCEYDELMQELAGKFGKMPIRVGIAGAGWLDQRHRYPAAWQFGGPQCGRAYVEWLRNAKICVAPVTREVKLNGLTQPGDEDSTRTYELAAAHCFFIHRRTAYVERLYNEVREVPFYDDGDDLASKIEFFLENEHLRVGMAEAAHARAVPGYSLDNRAAEIVAALESV